MSTTREGIILSDRQRFHWLRLIRSQNVGPQTFRQLIRRYASAEAALEALPELARKGGRRQIRVAGVDEVERELAYAAKGGFRLVCIGEPDYPQLLRQIDGPPPLICIKGNASILNRAAVGIVGSRNASALGLRMTADFASELGKAGFAIVSGFARGIDSSAHRASLSTGTIAVMAGGADHIYPPENDKLYAELLDRNGVFISEMPLGWTPRSQDFPRRNRLIAGLGHGVLVVEAAQRSGSLITARYAADAGRLVFAIPGSPRDARARGPNSLIKNGAALVDCSADIIEALTPLAPHLPAQADLFAAQGNNCQEKPAEIILSPTVDTPATGHDLDEAERKRVLHALSPTPVDLETLSAAVEVPVSKLYLALMELDLAGRLVRHNGGFISLLPE
ncbi:MAG: DNA protecting protein DprA [Candidatus Tokpelaia hoelldobleri]|uniref:DNA protecting protein DprA n=1 Tax=Candidatus Tokpelaia hoelldobleri TaxID=1902579 RepID=A0A1U9JU49_9HYPH|nr:MAG: DNA protecting protein DprA [Candidatus Tokpelaia hoelldoblerii]